MSPFDLEGPTVINFSGGRSSAYMLRLILDHYNNQLPEDALVCFCNTGKEREETLVFIDECEQRWGVPILWLEYQRNDTARGVKGDPNVLAVPVSFSTAARKGQPFDALNKSRRFLPNINSRICTLELKVRTIDRYVRRDLGWQDFNNVLGIRADEPGRLDKAIFEECKVTFPLALAGIGKKDVKAHWRSAPFDLGIHSDFSNCDLCFLKATGQLIRVMKEEPERAAWWIEQEKRIAAHFSKRWSYEELLSIAQNQTELDFPDEDTGVSCFCGD